MALSDEEFSRLPPEVQKETRECEQQQRLAAIEYDHRIKSRRLSAALISVAGVELVTLAAAYFVDIHGGYFLLVGLVAGATGWLAVHLLYGVMGGMLLVGSSTVVANLAGFVMGLCPPLIIAWPLYIAGGAFVGLWAQGRRHMQDAGF